MLRAAWTTLGFACAVVLVTAAAPRRETAGLRYLGQANAIGSRLRNPQKRHNSDIGRLDDRAFRVRAAEIAQELAADLRDPSLQAFEKRPALTGLRQIGQLAAAVSPTLVAVLHAHDGESQEVYRVGYFCGVTEAMATVAPRDPAVIRALADALAQKRPRGICHTCDCALDALAAAGPAAAPIAGPVLEKLAQGPSIASFSKLEKTIEAIDGSRAMVSILLARATRQGVGIDDRAASLRALGKSYGELTPDDETAVRVTAETLLGNEFVDVRVAAAELLGHAGPPALGALVRGLDDARYDVRAAAARSLARLGPAAAPARERLIAALDPFLGTGEAAAEALVAIGPLAQADVEARARSAPRHLRPLVDATARAIRAASLAPVREALASAYTRGGGNLGYVDVEVVRGGGGQPYAPHGFRIRARIRGGAYTPSGSATPTIEETLTADDPPNAFFSALVGRRAGEQLRVLLSPETSPDPYQALPKIGRGPEGPPLRATGALFDVEVERVCEPVIWQLFRGGGIVGPFRFEVYCR